MEYADSIEPNMLPEALSECYAAAYTRCRVRTDWYILTVDPQPF